MTAIITWLAVSLVRLFEFLLFARAIMSWFPNTRGSKISEFLYIATEPLILPFRHLLDRVEVLRMFPIDLSFLCTFVVLEFVLNLLYHL